MTPVKIIALIFTIFSLVKLVVVLINPSSWSSVVKKMYAKTGYVMAFSVVAAVIILTYLLQELTIVQIFASMTFMMTLMMLQFSIFGKEIIELSDKFLSDKNLLKRMWPVLLIWIILMIWVIYEIFV